MNDSAANPVTTVSSLPLSTADDSTRAAAHENLRWAALGGAFLFSMLWGIRSFGIQDNNEGIYAEIAREMNARGDWVVPHLNGVPYLEKPPLLYWIEALLLRTLGDHEWVIRLGPVLCFAGTLAAVIWIGRQLRSTSLGRNAALLLCSAVGVVGMSRSLLFDGPLTCALAWTFGFFLHWRTTGSRRMLWAAYLALGAGVMVKGLLMAVLGGGTMVIATFLDRWSWRDVARILDPVGIALFAAVVVPWHLLACAREPGFAEFYFINEHVKRFLGTREPHDFYTGPIYYYLVRLPLYLGVWFFALPALTWRREADRRSVGEREGRRILVVALALAFTFFSCSQGKANYYLLSVMPAAALLVTLAWPRDGLRRPAFLACAAGVALIGIVFVGAPVFFAHKEKVAILLAGQQALLSAIGIALLTVALAIAWLSARRRNQAVFWCVSAAGLLMLAPLPALLQRADAVLSQRNVAEFFSGRRDERVVLYRRYEDISSFVYYFGRPVPVVESQSNELLYASKRYPQSPSFIDPATLRRDARTKRVWLVVKSSDVDQALREFSPESARVVRRYPRSAIIAVGPEETAAAGGPKKPAAPKVPHGRTVAGYAPPAPIPGRSAGPA